jgi:hypothetical protein
MEGLWAENERQKQPHFRATSPEVSYTIEEANGYPYDGCSRSLQSLQLQESANHEAIQAARPEAAF